MEELNLRLIDIADDLDKEDFFAQLSKTTNTYCNLKLLKRIGFPTQNGAIAY